MGEFSLVVLTMLFVSERSWKHHFVTLMLPYAFVVTRALVMPSRPRTRVFLGASLVLSAFLIACTSSEFGFLFGKHGDLIAQFYGLYLWAGVTLYVATAWRVMADRAQDTGTVPPLPGPHFGV